MNFIPRTLLLIALALASTANAQTLTFSMKTTTGDKTVTPEPSWATTPPASSCTAGGAWTGNKPVQGTETLPPTNKSATFDLSCLWAGQSTSVIGFAIPTTNTDGTPYTDHKVVRIRYGTSATALTQVKDVTPSGGSSTLITGLGAGTWFFAATAVNMLDKESDVVGPVNVTLTGGTNSSKSVRITVNPVPMPLTNFTAKPQENPE